MSTSTRRFARHFAEMVVAMMAGMVVLGLPVDAALSAVGADLHDAPAAMLSVMAAEMTVAMVAWMRYRGHAWRPTVEMSAAMLAPTFAVVALLASGAVEELGTLLAIEHVAMLASMLAAMLLRREEYAHAGHSGAEHAAAAA